MFRAVAPEGVPGPVQGPDAGSVRMLGDRLGMKEGGFRDLPFGAEGFGGAKGAYPWGRTGDGSRAGGLCRRELPVSDIFSRGSSVRSECRAGVTPRKRTFSVFVAL